ncbi:MAG TPA: sugar transferase [Vicinamibacterales bacterium]|nr:sugar transferase [Vicinamibacterales bacterium]
MKRLFDVVLSATGLVASLPVSLAIAAAIRLDDGGPVLFTQTRVGQGGRLFRTFKFRSMRVGSERVAVPAAEDDPRITRVGRLLRATAMDELPQLWNILRGDMSFVGPRPLADGEIEVGDAGAVVPLADITGYHDRHAVRPGLTGLTQVHASRDLSRRDKFRLDRLYVRHASFCFDLRLVLLSFWITARGRWEDRGRKF